MVVVVLEPWRRVDGGANALEIREAAHVQQERLIRDVALFTHLTATENDCLQTVQEGSARTPAWLRICLLVPVHVWIRNMICAWDAANQATKKGSQAISIPIR